MRYSEHLRVNIYIYIFVFPYIQFPSKPNPLVRFVCAGDSFSVHPFNSEDVILVFSSCAIGRGERQNHRENDCERKEERIVFKEGKKDFEVLNETIL